MKILFSSAILKCFQVTFLTFSKNFKEMNFNISPIQKITYTLIDKLKHVGKNKEQI